MSSGCSAKEDSRAFAQRLKSDEALRAQVEYWESTFASLPGEEAEPPPAGMFEKILDRIEGEGADLPGTMTKRAETGELVRDQPRHQGALAACRPRAEPAIFADTDGAGRILSPAFARRRRTVAGAGRRPLVRRSQPEGRRLPRRDAVILASAGAHREWLSRARHHEPRSALERFRAKWTPVRV